MNPGGAGPVLLNIVSTGLGWISCSHPAVQQCITTHTNCLLRRHLSIKKVSSLNSRQWCQRWQGKSSFLPSECPTFYFFHMKNRYWKRTLIFPCIKEMGGVLISYHENRFSKKAKDQSHLVFIILQRFLYLIPSSFWF